MPYDPIFNNHAGYNKHAGLQIFLKLMIMQDVLNIPAGKSPKPNKHVG